MAKEPILEPSPSGVPRPRRHRHGGEGENQQGQGLAPAAQGATRLPSGHPEGYLEAFAQIYADAADLVAANGEGRAPDLLAAATPGIDAGVRGVRFIEAAVASHRGDSAWTPIA